MKALFFWMTNICKQTFVRNLSLWKDSSMIETNSSEIKICAQAFAWCILAATKMQQNVSPRLVKKIIFACDLLQPDSGVGIQFFT